MFDYRTKYIHTFNATETDSPLEIIRIKDSKEMANPPVTQYSQLRAEEDWPPVRKQHEGPTKSSPRHSYTGNLHSRRNLRSQRHPRPKRKDVAPPRLKTTELLSHGPPSIPKLPSKLPRIYSSGRAIGRGIRTAVARLATR